MRLTVVVDIPVATEINVAVVQGHESNLSIIRIAGLVRPLLLTCYSIRPFPSFPLSLDRFLIEIQARCVCHGGHCAFVSSSRIAPL